MSRTVTITLYKTHTGYYRVKDVSPDAPQEVRKAISMSINQRYRLRCFHAQLTAFALSLQNHATALETMLDKLDSASEDDHAETV